MAPVLMDLELISQRIENGFKVRSEQWGLIYNLVSPLSL